MAEAPNPRRYTDDRCGLLPKVFIVYPHNPQPYVWISLAELQSSYPHLTPEQLKEEKKRLQQRQAQQITYHDELVHRFAQFLETNKIAVAYEGLLMDTFVGNHMKWFQDQMKDSDYIFLIITESFCRFLSNQPPDGKEKIFSGEFLHVFVHNPSKPIVPVFLGRQRKNAHLPEALRASTTYQIPYSVNPPHFSVQQPETDRLYAMLTRQNRIEAPAQVGVVPVVSGLSRRGPRTARLPPQSLWDQRHHQMFAFLIAINRPLTTGEETLLAEKPGFALHWRALASALGFGPADIERIMDVDGDAERCIQLLIRWRQREQDTTVSALVKGIQKIQNTVMLEIVYSIFNR